jgi:hypothetical protein
MLVRFVTQSSNWKRILVTVLMTPRFDKDAPVDDSTRPCEAEHAKGTDRCSILLMRILGYCETDDLLVYSQRSQVSGALLLATQAMPNFSVLP